VQLAWPYEMVVRWRIWGTFQARHDGSLDHSTRLSASQRNRTDGSSRCGAMFKAACFHAGACTWLLGHRLPRLVKSHQ